MSTRGTRIHAEREFRQDAQILVATDAAGEGINLQFCWLMINYDLPWNPDSAAVLDTFGATLVDGLGRTFQVRGFGDGQKVILHAFV